MGTIFHILLLIVNWGYDQIILTRENRRHRKDIESPDLLSSSLTAAPVCGNIFKETRSMISGITDFLQNGIWKVDLEKYPPVKAWPLQHIADNYHGGGQVRKR